MVFMFFQIRMLIFWVNNQRIYMQLNLIAAIYGESKRLFGILLSSIVGRAILSKKKIEMQYGARQPFEKPWHAELFATTVHLFNINVFSWSEWTLCLGEQLHLNGESCNFNSSDDFYKIWLRALIVLLESKNITDLETIASVQKRCMEAHLKTPHGQQINF